MIRQYLLIEDVFAFHEDQLARYGGADGVRDMGQLQAALFRPQTGYYKDLTEEAAALWESLSQNHPFVDENKRTAFAVTDTFLLINGLEITAGPMETWTFLINLYETREMNFENLDTWLRANTAPLLKRGGESFENVEAVFRAGAGFGVVLDGKYRFTV